MNCKPGDLAYLVNSEGRATDANVGAVVHVLHDSGLRSFGDTVWNVLACRPLVCADGSYVVEGMACDRNLRPISGVPVHDEQATEVTV